MQIDWGDWPKSKRIRCTYDIGDLVQIIDYPLFEEDQACYLGKITSVIEKSVRGYSRRYRLACDNGLNVWYEDNLVNAKDIQTVSADEFDEILQTPAAK